MKRFKHNLSSYNLLTCDMGEAVPVSFTEVLPGDSVQAHTSVFIRVNPLVAPVMHPVTVRMHHWFVPYRLLWDQWEDFITGGPDGTGASEAIPTVTTTVSEGDPLDYMGVPPGTASPIEVLAFPLYAYNLIWNEWYRDQDLMAERVLTDETMASIAWEKDYFTNARPWPQKGPEVTLPLGTSAPVGVDGASSAAANKIGIQYSDGYKTLNAAGAELQSYNGASTANYDLRADLSAASAASVSDLRTALALQRYQEARSRYGSRYTEYLRYLGVRSSDARLQRPEFLGGGKGQIAFSEVLQTGPDTLDEGIGRLFGHGISGMRSRAYRRFFEEHGCIISIMSVRPKTMYTQGVHRSWLRRTKEDFWQKELEHIGQQEILTKEIYADAATEGFGYADRYFEYRSTPNRVSAEFRSTLDYWHMGRILASEPTLNESFVTCNPTKRVYAEQTQDSLLCMTQNRMVARRLVSRSAMPRIY